MLAELDRRPAFVRKEGSRQAGSKTGGGRPAKNLLIGVIRCDGCGYAMNAKPAYGEFSAYHYCWSKLSGRPCSANAAITVDGVEQEVMHQLRTRLGAMELGDSIFDTIAERWRALTMPEGEGERAVLQSRLDAVRGRIVDLEEARYVRGEFTPLMTSLDGIG